MNYEDVAKLRARLNRDRRGKRWTIKAMAEYCDISQKTMWTFLNTDEHQQARTIEKIRLAFATNPEGVATSELNDANSIPPSRFASIPIMTMPWR